MSYFSLISLFRDTGTKIGYFWCSGVYNVFYIKLCYCFYIRLCSELLRMIILFFLLFFQCFWINSTVTTENSFPVLSLSKKRVVSRKGLLLPLHKVSASGGQASNISFILEFFFICIYIGLKFTHL